MSESIIDQAKIADRIKTTDRLTSPRGAYVFHISRAERTYNPHSRHAYERGQRTKNEEERGQRRG
jgi:hypothetical protein